MRAYRHVKGRGRRLAYFFEGGTTTKPFHAPFMNATRDTAKMDDTPIWELQSSDARFVACVFSLSQVIDSRRSGFSDYLLLDEADTGLALEEGVERLLDFDGFLDAEAFIALEAADSGEPWRDASFSLPEGKKLPDLREHLDRTVLGRLAADYWMRAYERYQHGATTNPVGVCLPDIPGIHTIREAGQAIVRFLHGCLPRQVRRLVSITIDGVWSRRNGQAGSALFVCRAEDGENAGSEGFYDFAREAYRPYGKKDEDERFARSIMTGTLAALEQSPHLQRAPANALLYSPQIYKLAYRAAQEDNEQAFALWQDYTAHLNAALDDTLDAQTRWALLWPARRMVHDSVDAEAGVMAAIPDETQVSLLLDAFLLLRTGAVRPEKDENPEKYRGLLLSLPPQTGREALRLLLEKERPDHALALELAEKYTMDIPLDATGREQMNRLRDLLGGNRVFLDTYGAVLYGRIRATAREAQESLPDAVRWANALYGDTVASFVAFLRDAGHAGAMRDVLPALFHKETGGLPEAWVAELPAIYHEQGGADGQWMRRFLLGAVDVPDMDCFLLRFMPDEWENAEDGRRERWAQRRCALRDQAVVKLLMECPGEAGAAVRWCLDLPSRWAEDATGVVAAARTQIGAWDALRPFLAGEGGLRERLARALRLADMPELERLAPGVTEDGWYGALISEGFADAYVAALARETHKPQSDPSWFDAAERTGARLQKALAEREDYREAWGWHRAYSGAQTALLAQKSDFWAYFQAVQEARAAGILSPADWRMLLPGDADQPCPTSPEELPSRLCRFLTSGREGEKMDWGGCLDSALGQGWQRAHPWKDAHPHIQCLASLLELLREEGAPVWLYAEFSGYLDTQTQYCARLTDVSAIRAAAPAYLEELSRGQQRHMPKGLYEVMKERMA